MKSVTYLSQRVLSLRSNSRSIWLSLMIVITSLLLLLVYSRSLHAEPAAITSYQASNDSNNVYYQLNYTSSYTYYRVYIDTDQNAASGFQTAGIGANYLLENKSLFAYSGSGSNWSWRSLKSVTYSNAAGVAKWTVARANIGESTNPNQANLVFQVEAPLTTSAKLTHVYSTGATATPTRTPTVTPSPTALPTTAITTKTVSYASTTDLFANPERGFYRYFESRSSAPTVWATTELSNTNSVSWLSAAEEATISQFYCLFYLDTFQRSNISQSFLNHIQTNLNNVRSVGRKCILRFAYTDDSSDANNDDIPDVLQNANLDTEPDLPQLLTHISQLKPLLQANADVISVLQAGFIGLWGEWYYTDHFVDDPTQPDLISATQYDRRKSVVLQLLDALPMSRTIALRYPLLKKNMFARTTPITPSEAFQNTPIGRLGFHNDAFLNSFGDSGTFQSDADRTYLQAESLYLSMGGEINSPESGAPSRTCADALREMAIYHWSYINTDYYIPVLQSWSTGGCIHATTNISNSILDRLGYRLILRQGTYPTTAVQGGQMSIRLSVSNEGFAAPYNAREAFLVLRNTVSGVYFTAKLPDDPRLWLAGNQLYTISRTLNITTAVPAGTYALSLHLADPSPTLRNRPEYSIRTANANLWRTTSGWNDLSHTVTITNAVAQAEPTPLADDAIELVEGGVLLEQDDPLIGEEEEAQKTVFLPLLIK